MTGDFKRGMGYGLTLGSVAVGLAVALTLCCLDADACGIEDAAPKNLTDGEPVHPVAVFTADGGVAPIFHVADELALEPNPGHNAIGMDVYVLAYKIEADEDFHVVVADTPSWANTMIAELPAPHCTTGSPYSAQMANARADFIALFGIPTKNVKRLKVPVRVRMTGVVYFDHLHGQLGVAPSGVELHPLLSIERLP